MYTTTLGEQYQAILSSMRDLERELANTEDQEVRNVLLSNIERLHDASVTIKQLERK